MVELEKGMAEILELLREGGAAGSGGDAHASGGPRPDADTIFGSTNMMHIASRDAYAFALRIVDFLFSKDELKGALLFSSKKSAKPGLDHEKVKRLLRIVKCKYSDDEWDMKTLTSKINQKCRDSGHDRRSVRAETTSDVENTAADN